MAGRMRSPLRALTPARPMSVSLPRVALSGITLIGFWVLGSCQGVSQPQGVAESADAGEHTGVRPVHWGYDGADGPQHWAELCTGYEACGEGHHQSPVNLHSSDRALHGAWSVDYGPTTMHVAHHAHRTELIDNGHTIQGTCSEGSQLTVGDHTYELKQFHFHTPSEHTVDGVHSPMEMHLVHQATDGTLAVLGILFEEGQHNGAFDTLISVLPDAVGDAHVDEGAFFDVDALLPLGRSSYEYEGSLTTPPCTEGVRWLIATERVQMSAAQIAEFSRRIGPNNRPIQRLNDRTIGASRPPE